MFFYLARESLWVWVSKNPKSKKWQQVQSKSLHSELELEILSRFSSRDEFSRVETRRVERHFFVPTLIFGKRLVPTRFSCFFAIFLQIFTKIRVGTSFRESERVQQKLEKLVSTRIL